MSKDTALRSSTVDDISQDISGVSISDNSSICGSCSTDNTTEICANCGKEEGSLKSCAACKLVKYCSRDCQIAHRPQHKKECRKRAAELHDKKLFKDPPQQYEDCPICFLRLPLLDSGRRYKSCCGKTLCSGCIYAMQKRDDDAFCPFCRTPTPYANEEVIERQRKRVELNDAQAIRNLGCNYSQGDFGLTRDYTKALELLTRAEELGHVEAYYSIGYAYEFGQGVKRDTKKSEYYYELGATGGDVDSRYSLGGLEMKRGNVERSIKHWLIAAGGGDKDSLSNIQKLYRNGRVTKDDFAQALLSYQKYLDEVKSSQRDEAAAAREDYKYI